MDIENLCLVIPNFLDKSECQNIINFYEDRKILSHTESSSYALDGKLEKNSYKVVEVDFDSDLGKNIISKQELALQQWVNHLEKQDSFHIHILKPLLRFPHKIRILKYSKNQSIHAHSDWSFFTHASITLNLNDDYEGGDFVFFNGKYTLKLNAGDALIFPADPFWVHEVSPVTSGSRYSVNSFIKSMSEKNYLDLIEYGLTKKDNDPLYKLI